MQYLTFLMSILLFLGLTSATNTTNSNITAPAVPVKLLAVRQSSDNATNSTNSNATIAARAVPVMILPRDTSTNATNGNATAAPVKLLAVRDSRTLNATEAVANTTSTSTRRRRSWGFGF